MRDVRQQVHGEVTPDAIELSGKTRRGRPDTSSQSGATALGGGQNRPLSVHGVTSTTVIVSRTRAGATVSTRRRGFATGSPRKLRWYTSSNAAST